MKKRFTASPPRWAERLLEWYCRPELLEDLQGDLNEYFERNVKQKGPLRARLIYVVDVLKFFRSYTIRKPEIINILIHWLMLNSYLKTSSRSIARHKLFSAVNIIGLSISMSVGLVMIAFISDLASYDKFHEKSDRIFRVISGQHNNIFLASTSVKVGKEIKASIAGVEDVTIMRRGFGGDVSAGENVLPINGLWADESFFNVFTFPLIQGDPSTALKEPYSIVLTETTAQKLFGATDVLGKSIKYDTAHYIVTGLVKDVPQLSHLRFEALASFSTIEALAPDTDGGFLNWTSIYMNYVYVVLPEGGNAKLVQSNIDKLCARENASRRGEEVILELQPVTEISIGKSLGNQLGPKLPALALWILSGLAFFVIVSACFNYTNLSIARSLKRSREVGIRKVIGAMKTHILGQFIAEAVIIALLALVLSLPLFVFLRSQFLSLDPFIGNLVTLELSPKIVLYFIAFAFIVGICAGFLPALFFSKMNAIKVLKNVWSLQVLRHVSLRKGLVVVQYVFSLIFITTTIIGYHQYKSFIKYDLGFNTENILNIKLQGNNPDLLINALSQQPEVKEMSRSLIVMGLGNRYGLPMKYLATNDSTDVMLNFVDSKYLSLHEHKFLAGKTFSAQPEHVNESEVIVNEQLLRTLNIGGGNPAKAIGEFVSIDGKKLAIVGVVEDFHYETIEEKIQPMAFRHLFKGMNGYYVNAKIDTRDLKAAMSGVEAAWRKIDKVHPLEAKFYSDQIEAAYKQFSVMIKVIGFLAFLAISIASMGLFGMVVFTTETRLKEISIRKVMGASEGKLVFLLSKGFLFLLSLAALIALPVTYLFFEQIVLTKFAYHEPIRLMEVLAGLFIVLSLAALMIFSQTLKMARANPAVVLKNEG